MNVVTAEDLIKKIKKGNNLLLTGPAGTGKSTLIRELKKHFKNKMVLTSTTGVSALNLGGATIHSFSGIGIHTDPRAITAIQMQQNWFKVRSRIRQFKIIVIDEVSMLRSDQLELIDIVFRTACDSKEPFGGKVMIFTGDFLQLPPVVKKTEPHAKGWIFNSKKCLDAKIEAVHLYKIYRQDDAEFLKHLINVRFGWCTEETNQFFQSRSFQEQDLDPTTLRFFSTNLEADSFNERNLKAIQSESHFHRANIYGINEYYEKQIKNSTLALEHLELKVGARVMFICNMKEEGSDGDFVWVNGSLGTITDYVNQSPVVKIDETEREVVVDRFTWKMTNWEDDVLASFEQIPLKLAYGVTIHKSQGLTLNKAIIDCRRIFAEGQGYVAFSRVKKAEGLYLLNWDPSLVKANPEAVDFYLKSMEES